MKFVRLLGSAIIAMIFARLAWMLAHAEKPHGALFAWFCAAVSLLMAFVAIREMIRTLRQPR